MPEEEKKKREDERAKKVQEEIDETTNAAKRKGIKMFIHGRNFMKTNYMRARFIFNPQVYKDVPVIFKNERKLACDIPDMGGEVPVGHHQL